MLHTLQKFLMMIFIVILHILWILSAILYYDTTYKKYIETRYNFDWQFIFKNKKLPFSEQYHIIFHNEKIGQINRIYDKYSKGFRISTQAILSIQQQKFFLTISENNQLKIFLTVILNPIFEVSEIKATVDTVKNCNTAKGRCKPENLVSIYGKRIKDKFAINFSSKIFPIKNINFEIGKDALKNSLGQNFIFFGTRPAVGKSWTIKLGTFEQINATVEEKFTKETQNGEKVTIFSITYSSPRISGYAWIDEKGELLKLNLYSPPILIIKKGLEF